MSFGFGMTPNKGFNTGGSSPSFNRPGTANTYGGSTFGAPAAAGFAGGNNFQQTNTFGQQNRAFGSSSPGTVGGGGFASPFGGGGATSSGFGGSSPGFGKSPTVTNFGAATGAGFGGAGGFGAPAQQQPFGAMGSGVGGFGAAATSTGFGGTTGTFGGNTGAGGFGATNVTPFGGSSVSNNMPFGGAASAPFGATGGGGFGATTPGVGAFSSVAPAPFGASAGGAFGAPVATAVATPVFGAPPAGGGFGAQTAPAFGGGASAPFGATPPSGGFGGFGGALGGQMGGAGGTGNPPFAPEQTTEAGKPGSVATRLNIQVITGMAAYANKSLEELRVEDYRRGVKGPGGGAGLGGGLGGATSFGGSAFGAPTASTSMFGSAPPASTTGGLFGGPPAANTAFGTTGTGAFGSTATPTFGAGQFGQQQPQQQPQATGGFNIGGGLGAPSAFAAPAGAQTGGFGSTGAFGAPAAGGGFGAGGGFSTGAGATATKPLFSGLGSTPAAGASSTGFGSTGAFGAPPVTQFGAPPNTFGQQQQPAAGAFGSTSGFGNFGATNAAPAANLGGFGFGNFGAAPAATANTFGAGFGTTPAAGAKQATSFGGFGAPGNFSFSSFSGQQPAAAHAPAPFQSPNVLQSASLDHKMQYLNRKQDELEIQMKDDKLASQFHSQSQAAPSVLNKSDNSPAKVSTSTTVGSAILGRHAPRSAVKIAPRSFAPQTPGDSSNAVDDRQLSASSITSNLTRTVSKSATTAGDLGATTSFLRPEGLLGRSVKKLVIAPHFHQSKDMEGIPALSMSSVNTPQAQIQNRDMEVSAQPSSMNSPRTAAPEATPLRNTVALTNTVSDKGRKPASGEPTGLTPYATRSPLDLNFSNRHIETPVARSSLTPLDGNGSSNGSGSSSTVAKPGQTASVIRSDVFSDVRPVSSPTHSSTPKEKENNPSPHVQSNPVNLQPAQPPILTMDGYETSPSIEALQAMSRDDLTRISYFMVSRSQYGSIEWQSDTDVNGLNLDKIVRIEKNSVEVYLDEDSMKDKPPVGTALNKPAIVTLLNVLPKEGSSVSKVLQYESKLRETCRKNGAEFIDYNPVTGRWVFKVEHFSKYGLQDDDDDEPAVVPQPSIPAPMPPASFSSHAAITAATQANTTVVVATKNAALLQAPAFTNTKKLKINSDVFKSSSKLPATSRSANKPAHIGATTSLDTPYFSQSAQKATPKDFSSNVAASNPQLYHGVSTSKELAEIASGAVSTPRIKRSLFEPNSAVAARSLNLATVPVSTDNENEVLALQWSDEVSRKNNPLTLQKSFTQSELPLTYEDTIPFKKGRVQVHPDTKQVYTLFDDSYTGPEIKERKQGILDCTRAFGTSFRVGWAPNGRIVHSGLLSSLSAPQTESQRLNVQRVSVETVRPLPSALVGSTKSDIDALVVGPWEALLPHCQSSKSLIEDEMTDDLNQGSNSIPLWRIPVADVDNWSEYTRFLEFLKSCLYKLKNHSQSADHLNWTSQKIVELFQAAVGQEVWEDEPSSDIMPLLEFRSQDPVQWQRRRAAISAWLKSICVDQVKVVDNAVDGGQFGENAETYERIFQLLSCHRMVDAIQVTENAGVSSLASYLTQANTDDSFSVSMRNQLAVWVDKNEDALMADELLNVYRVLASVPTRFGPLPDKLFPYSTLTNLGWSRSVGIFYWYCFQSSQESEAGDCEGIESLEPMASALLQYKMALADGDADFPTPRYNSIASFSSTNPQKYSDSLYNLLEVLFGNGESINGALDGSASQEELLLAKSKFVVAALESESNSSDSTDYRASALILLLLQSCGMIPTELNSQQPSPYPAWLLTGATIVRQHVISQLLLLGHWKWAVFVSLLIEDEFQRNYLVTDIIARYSHMSSCTGAEEEILSNEDLQTLVNQFHVPIKYVHQALGYYYGSVFNVDKQIEHYNFAGMSDEANEVLCEKKAPKIVIEGDPVKLSHLLQLLEAMNIDSANEILEVSEEESLSITLSKSELLLHYLRIRNDMDTQLLKNNTPANPHISDAHPDIDAIAASVMKRATNLILHFQRRYQQILTLKSAQKSLIASSRDPSSYALSVAGASVFEIACFHVTSYLLEVLDKIKVSFAAHGKASRSVFELVFPSSSLEKAVKSVPVYDAVRMDYVLKECVLMQKESTVQVCNQIRTDLLLM